MNPYNILGVHPGASDIEIRRAYFARVQEHPPERDPDGFKTVREAYEKLRDAAARARQFLEQFEEIYPEEIHLPEPVPVPLTRELILQVERRRCEVWRRDFSVEVEWSQ
ncbi:MAG: DnaJ domain-containing protein [Acidobacteria bacterium]|nr:DnaJ domain-containing protein [Acidobacteriota bacterium]